MIYKSIEKAFEEFNKLSNHEKEALPHINCCERLLKVSNESLSLQLSEDVFSITKGFGGGMKIESVCGALTGSVMALSHYYNDDDNLTEIIQMFFVEFKEQYGTHMCDILKEHYYKETTGCQNVMLKTAVVLDDIISRYTRKEVSNEQ